MQAVAPPTSTSANEAVAPARAGLNMGAMPSVAQLAGSPAGSSAGSSAYAGYHIIRRNGALVGFEPNKIAVALMKAFLAVHGTQGAASASVRETVDTLTEMVVRALLRSRPGGGTFHIEDVQDHVELGLMRGGHHEVARAYVLYRERRTQERARSAVPAAAKPAELFVIDGGQRVPLDMAALRELFESSCAGLGAEDGTTALRLDTNAASRASSASLRSSALRRTYHTDQTIVAAKAATTSQNRIVMRKV